MRRMDDFPLRTEATLIRYPDRYDDPRGRAMVETLGRLLPEPATSFLFFFFKNKYRV